MLHSCDKYDNCKIVNNIQSEVDSLYIGSMDSNEDKAASHKKDNIRVVTIKSTLDTGADANVLHVHF